MAANDIQLVIVAFKEQFSLVKTQLDDTKKDLSSQIKDVRSDIQTCLLRINDIEKKELILQIKADRTEQIITQRKDIWFTITKTFIICIVPTILALFYGVFALAAKMNISIF